MTAGGRGEGLPAPARPARRRMQDAPLLTALNGLTACLVLCAAGLLASGAAGPLHVGALLAAAAWQRWRWSGRGGDPDARRWWWELSSVGALFVFIADLFLLTRDLVGAALRLLVFIVAYHADNPQSAKRARQTLGLTLIQMIAASASTTEVSFSVLMAAYLVSALWTLAALGAAMREAKRPALAPDSPAAGLRRPLARMSLASAPAVLTAGLAIFFVIPHYGTGYFRERGRSLRRNLTGFSERIELGSIGSIKKSHATVMRIQKIGGDGPPSLPLRLRGVALDRFNGRIWDMSDQTRRALRPGPGGEYIVGRENLAALEEAVPAERTLRELRRRKEVLSLQVLMEPLESRVLFTPPALISVTTTRFHTVFVDRQGDLFAGGPRRRRLPYRTTSLADPAGGAPTADLSDQDRRRFTALPEVDPRVAALGRRVTAGLPTAEARARALETWLLGSFSYSLDVNDAGVADPLVHLLVEGRPGHCEYFATALAVLLRLEGIPSRVVTGFHGGEYSDLTDQVIVRQSDAHSWVEAWLPGSGWIALDPTPPDPSTSDRGLIARLRRFFDEAEIAWDTYIVGLDMQDQQSAFEEMRDWFDLTASGAVIRLRRAAAGLRELAGIAEGRLPASDGALGVAAAVLAAAAAAGAALAVRRRLRGGRPSLHPATLLFRRYERRAAGREDRRETWMSPAEFARRHGASEVAEAFEAARYGPESLRGSALARLREAVRIASTRPGC